MSAQATLSARCTTILGRICQAQRVRARAVNTRVAVVEVEEVEEVEMAVVAVETARRPTTWRAVELRRASWKARFAVFSSLREPNHGEAAASTAAAVREGAPTC